MRGGESTTDLHERARGKDGERSKQFGNERTKVFDAIALCHHDDDGDRQRAQILLISEVLIRVYEHVKPRRATCEEIAVLQARPALLADGANLVPRNLQGKLRRQGLVK